MEPHEKPALGQVQPEPNPGKIGWIAQNMKSIQQIAVSIIFIAGLGYAAIDWLGTKFVTKLEAGNYALQKNVNDMDNNLAETQMLVLRSELKDARMFGVQEQDKVYLRSIDKRIFMLQIKLGIIKADENDYIVPNWLQ